MTAEAPDYPPEHILYRIAEVESIRRDAAASLERFAKIGLSATLLSNVEKIEASGPLELMIKLKKVQSNFLDTLSSPGNPLAIYPAEEARKDPKDFKFIGTGPMKYVEYKPDSHVLLERFAEYTPNPNYTGRDGLAGRKEVNIDRAMFRFMPEFGARNAGMQTGELQVNENTDGPTAKRLAGDSKVQVIKVMPFGLQIGKFNHAQAPCNDANFRRAVQACLDMEAIMAIAHADNYKLEGGLLYGYSPYYAKTGLNKYNTADVAKAKELLAKSPYKGETLTFITDTLRNNVDVATSFKEQLAQIGIKIDVKIADWPTVSTMGFTPNGCSNLTDEFSIERRTKSRGGREAGGGDAPADADVVTRARLHPKAMRSIAHHDGGETNSVKSLRVPKA